MGKNLDAFMKAGNILERAMLWNNLCGKLKRGDLVPEPVITQNGDVVFEYKLANPERIAKEIKDMISEMDADTRKFVFEEVDKVAEHAQQGIAENGGSDNSQAGDIIKACNAVKSFRVDVEKEEAQKISGLPGNGE